jgi:hypothetical protein
MDLMVAHLKQIVKFGESISDIAAPPSGSGRCSTARTLAQGVPHPRTFRENAPWFSGKRVAMSSFSFFRSFAVGT